jgi:multidrug efflux pump subunit AcrB
MFLADLCVIQPAVAATLILCLVAMGWFSYTRLGLDLFSGGPLPEGAR